MNGNPANTAACSGCGATYDVTGRPAGKRLRCPDCGTTFVVPEAAPPREDAVRRRARAKLEAARRDPDAPIGPNTRRTVVLALCCGIPVLLLGLVFLAAPKNGPTIFAVTLLVGLVLLGPWPLVAHLRSRPSSPARALREFYRCVARGDHRRARALVLSADLDELERDQPDLAATIGRPSFAPFRFADGAQFARYWSEMLRANVWPLCIVRLHRLRIRSCAPDVAVAEFDIHVRTNTNLHALLILLGCIGILIAMIVQAATNRTHRESLRRVLVRVGDEWRLLSGEWMGEDEEDLAWLEP